MFLWGLFREPYHHGQKPRVPLQRPGAGPSGAREDAVRGDASGARRLGVRSEGATGETRHRHEAGDGAEVCSKMPSVEADEWNCKITYRFNFLIPDNLFQASGA